MASVPSLLVVHPDVPARSVGELVALAKSRPGRLNFGPGGTPHLASELFKLRAGIDVAHVPYCGVAPAITALLAREVELAILDLPVLLPHMGEGRLRALGVTGPRRSPALPEVPVFAEAGIGGMEVENWYALLAPAGTAPAPRRRGWRGCTPPRSPPWRSRPRRGSSHARSCSLGHGLPPLEPPPRRGGRRRPPELASTDGGRGGAQAPTRGEPGASLVGPE